MSVVAVKIYKDEIVIGADSFVSFSQYTQIKDKGVKIFKQGGMIVGCTGWARDCSLFRLYCRDRKPSRNDEDAIIDFMREFIESCKKIDSNYRLESDFIIVYKGKVYYFSSEFYLKEIVDYAAMGAGQDMAMAALYLSKSVKEAIEVACELSIYCEKPINIFKIKK